MKIDNPRSLVAWYLLGVLLIGLGRQGAIAADNPSSLGPELVLQTGHTDSIRSLAISPDGKLLVTGSADYTAILWDVATGRQLRRFAGHTGGLVSVAFSPDGQRVLTAPGLGDKSIIIWDAATGKRITTIRSDYFHSAAFSPDGRQVLANSGPGRDAAALWDASTGALLKRFDGGADQAASSNYDAVFSGDGRYVLTGGSRYKPKPTDGYVFLWDVETGAMVRTLEGHQYTVVRVAISPKGAHAASVARRYENEKALLEVLLWDVATGRKVHNLKGHTAWVNSVAFSPDGKQLLTTSSDDTAILWSAESGEKLHILKNGHFTVYCGAFSPDGRQAFTAGDDHLVVAWDVATGQMLKTFGQTGSYVRSAAFSRDCKQLAFEHYPGGIFLWETETGQPPRRVGEGSSGKVMAFTPDGRYLLGGAHYGPSLWDVAAGKEVYELQSHHPKCGLTAMAFRADGQQVLTGGYGLKDAAGDSGQSRWFSELLLTDTATGTRLRAFEGHEEWLTFAAVSPDGTRVLSGEKLGRIVLWDAATGRALRVLQEKGNSPFVATPVAFSPDGRQALGGSWHETAILWDVATGAKIRAFRASSGTPDYASASLSAVTFRADGRRILIASEGGSAVLWDAVSGQKLQTFRATGGAIRQAAFHPNGRHALTQSADWTVRVWDIENGQELARLLHVGEKADWLVVTPQGLFDGSEAARQQILFRVGGRLDVAPVDRFFQDFYRPGLLAEIAKGQRPVPNVEFGKSVAPLVRIVSPQRSGTLAAVRATLQVEVTDRGGGIRGPWLMQNGARVLAPGQSRREGRTLLRSLTLPLITGENRLEVRAASEDGSWESEPATITLVYEEPQVQPELHVLAVGINQYAQETLNLKYAVPDARAIADVFLARGPALYGQGKVHVTALVNDQATRAGIRTALDRAAKTAKAQDTMIVFLAGHGTTIGQRYYFIPHEFKNRSEKLEEDIQSQGLPGDVLGDGLGAVAALKRVLIFDTCQSGGNIALQRTARNPFAFRGALERLSRDQGVFTIAATASTADAQELPQLGHGVLSYALLAALGAVEVGPLEKQPVKTAVDNTIGVREWFSYAQDKVPQLTRLYFGQEQLVGFSGQGNNFAVLPAGRN